MNATPKFAVAALAALLVVTEAHAMRWYSPNTGRWLSRDSIGESGGLNVYAFAQNDPIGRIDILGLCAGKCGVKSLDFVGQGWTKTATGFQFNFDVVIKYKEGNGYDPSCCRYVQWVQAKALTVNGKLGAGTSAGGTPMDGNLHVDSWPYKGDSDTNPSGGVYTDLDSADDVFKGQDTPSWGGFNYGDAIDYDMRFEGRVIDICSKSKIVKKKNFKITAIGPWPNLKYDP